MDRFGLYAQYYDLLYRDKDYVAESEYVDRLIKQYNPFAKKLLNLGCGTGKHDYALANLGYVITGVDLSAEMAEQAQYNTPANIAAQLKFVTGDIRTVALNATFDTIISLFHVMSYQVTNKDLSDTIDTAYKHLEQDGMFIFDCWYGPGVLTDLPTVRIKQMANDDISVTRSAKPILNSLENTVDVNYTILINHNNSTAFTEVKESHKMRYLFVKEIELLITSRFRILAVNDWLKTTAPQLSSWNAVFVLQKI